MDKSPCMKNHTPSINSINRSRNSVNRSINVFTEIEKQLIGRVTQLIGRETRLIGRVIDRVEYINIRVVGPVDNVDMWITFLALSFPSSQTGDRRYRGGDVWIAVAIAFGRNK